MTVHDSKTFTLLAFLPPCARTPRLWGRLCRGLAHVWHVQVKVTPGNPDSEIVVTHWNADAGAVEMVRMSFAALARRVQNGLLFAIPGDRTDLDHGIGRRVGPDPTWFQELLDKVPLYSRFFGPTNCATWARQAVLRSAYRDPQVKDVFIPYGNPKTPRGLLEVLRDAQVLYSHTSPDGEVRVAQIIPLLQETTLDGVLRLCKPGMFTMVKKEIEPVDAEYEVTDASTS